jgi:hypothetical protein
MYINNRKGRLKQLRVKANKEEVEEGWMTMVYTLNTRSIRAKRFWGSLWTPKRGKVKPKQLEIKIDDRKKAHRSFMLAKRGEPPVSGFLWVAPSSTLKDYASYTTSSSLSYIWGYFFMTWDITFVLDWLGLFHYCASSSTWCLNGKLHR